MANKSIECLIELKNLIELLQLLRDGIYDFGEHKELVDVVIDYIRCEIVYKLEFVRDRKDL